jgi:hypothetical protein
MVLCGYDGLKGKWSERGVNVYAREIIMAGYDYAYDWLYE